MANVTQHWKASPAYKAYLVLGRLPKKCPPFDRAEHNSTLIIHRGEVWCRQPGEGPQGLCAKRAYTKRSGLCSHLAGSRLHPQVWDSFGDLEHESNQMTTEFYKDLMKDEDYEGKDETGPEEGRPLEDRGHTADPIHRAEQRFEGETFSSVEAMQKRRAEKRKRQEHDGHAKQPEGVNSRLETHKKRMLEADINSELPGRGRYLFDSSAFGKRTAMGAAESLAVKLETINNHTTDPDPSMIIQQSHMEGRQSMDGWPTGVIDLTQDEEATDDAPTIKPSKSATPNFGKPRSIVTPVPMPRKQVEDHQRTQTTVSEKVRDPESVEFDRLKADHLLMKKAGTYNLESDIQSLKAEAKDFERARERTKQHRAAAYELYKRKPLPHPADKRIEIASASQRRGPRPADKPIDVASPSYDRPLAMIASNKMPMEEVQPDVGRKTATPDKEVAIARPAVGPINKPTTIRETYRSTVPLGHVPVRQLQTHLGRQSNAQDKGISDAKAALEPAKHDTMSYDKRRTKGLPEPVSTEQIEGHVATQPATIKGTDSGNTNTTIEPIEDDTARHDKPLVAIPLSPVPTERVQGQVGTLTTMKGTSTIGSAEKDATDYLKPRETVAPIPVPVDQIQDRVGTPTTTKNKETSNVGTTVEPGKNVTTGFKEHAGRLGRTPGSAAQVQGHTGVYTTANVQGLASPRYAVKVGGPQEPDEDDLKRALEACMVKDQLLKNRLQYLELEGMSKALQKRKTTTQ